MIHIKCRECGEFSTQDEVCSFCGALLKSEKTHKQTIEKQHQERIAVPEEPPKVLVVLKKWQKSPNFLLQAIGFVGYNVLLVLFAIMSFVAWLFATVAV